MPPPLATAAAALPLTCWTRAMSVSFYCGLSERVGYARVCVCECVNSRKGVPFRETHHIAGEAVRVAEEQNKPLDHLTVAELHELHPEFTDDVVKVSFFYHSRRRMAAALASSSLWEQFV